MGARRFGALALQAGVKTTLMTGAAGFDSTVVAVFVNHDVTNTAVINLAIVQSTDPNTTASQDYIVFNQNLLPNSHMEFKGIAVESGHILVASSDIVNVTATAYGFEETTAPTGGGTAGEPNTASNLGTGEKIFTFKNGFDLPFKSLKSTSNIVLSSDANEITISDNLPFTFTTFDVTFDVSGNLADAVNLPTGWSKTISGSSAIIVHNLSSTFFPQLWFVWGNGGTTGIAGITFQSRTASSVIKIEYDTSVANAFRLEGFTAASTGALNSGTAKVIVVLGA